MVESANNRVTFDGHKTRSLQYYIVTDRSKHIYRCVNVIEIGIKVAKTFGQAPYCFTGRSHFPETPIYHRNAVCSVYVKAHLQHIVSNKRKSLLLLKLVSPGIKKSRF